MKNTISLIILLTTFLGFSQTNTEICVEDMNLHLKFLASDSIKGRFPGTPEDKVAAEYIQTSFKNTGLLPLFETFLQPFNLLTGVEIGTHNKLEFAEKKYKIEKDFCPVSFTSNSSLDAQVVFVGYGFDVTTEKLVWNDYGKVDCKNKWVIVLKGFPETDGENPFVSFSKLRSKVITAKDHGAAGVLLVAGVQYEKDDLIPGVHYDRIAADAGIPVFHITRKTADDIFKQKSDTLKISELEKQIDVVKKPLSFAINTVLKAEAEIIKRTTTTYNIAGIIKGSSKDRFIVIGAHYDHLGFGGSGTGSRNPDTVAIHYGADDNASGTVGIMELGEKLLSENPEHSIILVAFGAEEMGLLGSKHFVDNLPINKDSVELMINLDMIGRLDKTFTIGGTGTAVEFDSLLNLVETKSSFFKSPEGYGPSDHASFYSENIPVLYYNSGIHTDYHTPADSEEKINYEGMKEILDFVYQTVIEVDKLENGLTFKESGSKTSSRQSNLKVTLGIIPDFGGDVEGLGIGGVKNGGPAEAAGLKKGDIIKSINGEKVGEIYEYMQRLSKLKSGETAIIEIDRNGEIIVVLVQL